MSPRQLTVAALGTAVLGSMCCTLPALLAVVGLGGAAAGAAFAPYRPFFVALTLVLFGLAGRAWWRGRGGACCVVDRQGSRRTTALVAAGLLLSAALVAYPAIQAAKLNQADAAVGEPVARLHVDGLTCSDCALHVQRTLEQVPGVESAAVDLPTGKVAVYGAPGASLSPERLAATVTGETPYQARPEEAR